MAVTVHQTPAAREPVYNPQMFLAISSNIAQPNFLYRVILTDMITGNTQTYDCAQDTTGYLKFDAGPFAENLMAQYCPINVYGWQKCTDGIRTIRINIGEYYGASPAYVAGSNFDWIVWNGVQDYSDKPGFSINTYLYDNTVPNYAVLTGRVNSKTYEDRSDLLYVLTKGAGDLKYLFIDRFDLNGVGMTASVIPNPYEASTTYTDKYLCIDVGYKGLLNISSGLVTGAYPIITSQVGSYRVSETNSAVPDPVRRLIKEYTIGCEPRFPIYTFHYLKRNGSFETIHFNKRSDFEYRKDQTTYKTYPYRRSGTTYTYSRSTPIERVLSTATTERLKLNTDWLTSDQVDLHRDLFDSPRIYWDQGSSLAYSEVQFVSNSYKLNKSWNEKLFQLNADFELSHSNYRQRI